VIRLIVDMDWFGSTDHRSDVALHTTFVRVYAAL